MEYSIQYWNMTEFIKYLSISEYNSETVKNFHSKHLLLQYLTQV